MIGVHAVYDAGAPQPRQLGAGANDASVCFRSGALRSAPVRFARSNSSGSLLPPFVTRAVKDCGCRPVEAPGSVPRPASAVLHMSGSSDRRPGFVQDINVVRIEQFDPGYYSWPGLLSKSTQPPKRLSL